MHMCMLYALVNTRMKVCTKSHKFWKPMILPVYTKLGSTSTRLIALFEHRPVCSVVHTRCHREGLSIHAGSLCMLTSHKLLQKRRTCLFRSNKCCLENKSEWIQTTGIRPWSVNKTMKKHKSVRKSSTASKKFYVSWTWDVRDRKDSFLGPLCGRIQMT